MATKSPGRKLNPLEQKLHQAALADPNKTLTQKDAQELAPDGVARTNALNFLLGTGMFKVLKDAKAFRAVTKEELDVKKDLGGEEQMVLSHIQAAANEGIWTKHLKTKTELHQTVIDRCLKSLAQKQLIKAVKNVKFPTRKIYMLSHLEPSVELTGGPWYTDNELDTEFIKLLCSACLRFVKDRSYPKQKPSSSNSSNEQALYSISASPSYPTAQQIQTFLSKSRITETQLTVEHVDMLLNVLILDGEIEKVPAFGAALWEANEANDDDPSDEEEVKRKRKKRRRDDGDDDEEEDRPERKKRKKKRAAASDDPASTSESDQPRSKKRSKSRKSGRSEESDEEGADDRKKRKRNRGRKEDDSDDAGRSRSRSKKAGKKKSRGSGSDSDSSSSEEDTRRSTTRSPRKRSRKRSSSPGTNLNAAAAADLDIDYGGAHVYRAIRQERVTLGWSQAPCGRCPQFEFCNDRGPVNPRECEYYGEWLGTAAVKIE